MKGGLNVRTLLRILAEPRRGLEDALRSGRTWPSVVLGTLGSTTTAAAILGNLAQDLNPGLLLLLSVPLAGLMWYLVTWVLHGTALVFGGRGSHEALLRLWGYTRLPGILGITAGIVALPLSRVALSTGGGMLFAAAGVLGAIAIGVWGVVISLHALNRVYLMGRRAWFPLIGLWAILFLGGTLSQVLWGPTLHVPLANLEVMEPTLTAPPEHLAVPRGAGLNLPVLRGKHLRRGDLVVIGSSHDPLIARVIALPGDTVEIRAGLLFLEGNAVPENRASGASHWSDGPYTLVGEVYVLGDNRAIAPEHYGGGVVPLQYVWGKPARWALAIGNSLTCYALGE